MIEEIKKLREERVSVKDICDQLHISSQTLYEQLNKYGLKKYYYNQNSDLMNKSLEIAEKYSSGRSIASLSREYSCSQDPIIKMLAKHNIVRRSCEEQKQLEKKYNFNERYFQFIDSDSKAYLLGLLMADGYINKKTNTIKLALQTKDSDALDFFVSELESNKPAKIYYPKGNNPICLASVISKDAVTDLYQWGCVQKKSLTLMWPQNIDERFIPSLIRGYFDGDGCAHQVKEPTGYSRLSVNLISANNFIQGLSKYLNRMGVDHTIRKLHEISETNSSLEVRSTLGCWRFFQLIYHKDFCFKRKKDKFINFFASKKDTFNKNLFAKKNLITNLEFHFSKNNQNHIVPSSELASFCKKNNLSKSKVYENSLNGKTHKKWKIERIEIPNKEGLEFYNWLMSTDLNNLNNNS